MIIFAPLRLINAVDNSSNSSFYFAFIRRPNIKHGSILKLHFRPGRTEYHFEDSVIMILKVFGYARRKESVLINIVYDETTL